MKKILTLFILTLYFSALGQDRIYYDKDWKETTNKDYVYYRPLPLKKVGELIFIQDYYKNGQLQYQGYSYQDDEFARVGDAYWYRTDGLDPTTAHYENLSDTKELIYYYQNGKEWKKILYNQKGEKRLETVYIDKKEPIIGEYNNEQYYGSFLNENFPTDYHTLKRNMYSRKDTISLNDPKILSGNSQNYTEIVYWSNGNKAKEIIYKNEYKYERHSISTKYWDINGKPLNDLNTNYSYYTKFGIAQSVKIKNEQFPKDNKWSNQRTTYYPNGKVKEINRSTWKDTEIISYDEKGKESIQLLKERREPYDGFFTDTINSKVTQYHLKKGIHIGEVITTKYTTDSIFAKGIYKDNKPYEGTFYNLENKRMLSSYKNFLLDGVQTKYSNYYYDIPEEIYEMKNGVLDGYKKIYKKGVLLSEESFKNGVPINGSIIEENTKKTYKDSALFSIGYYKKDYSDRLTDLLYIEYYVNDVIDHVVYDTFQIIDDTQPTYTGYYKDEKPYKGYFISEEIIIDKIPLINYYEDGQLLYQYSFDFIQQSDDYSFKTLYDLKTTYKDNKIVDGYKYITEKWLLVKIGYKNTEINKLEINAFGMHAFNRKIYDFKNNKLYIQDSDSKTYIVISHNGKYLTAELYDNKGNLIKKEQPIVKDQTPNSEKAFYLEDNKLKSYSVVSRSDEYYQSMKEELSSMFIASIYYSFPKFLKLSPSTYFSQYTSFVEKMTNEAEDEGSENKDNLSAQLFQGANIYDNQIAALLYDEKGKPSQGIDVNHINNKYKVDYYLEGKILKTSYYKSIDNLKEGKLLMEFIEILQNKKQ